MLDCQFYGRHPAGHHLTNVLLHAATAIVLFLVLQRVTGDLWPSALAAALFAIHPLRAESVAWVAERKDVLSGLFFMLTLAAYVAYVRRPVSIARYLLVVLLFALGLMAKPMLVTLPFVLLLLDYWPLGRFARVRVPVPLRPVRLVRPLARPLVQPLVPKPQFGNVPLAFPSRSLGQVKRRKVRGQAEERGKFLAWPRLVIEKIPLLALAAASCGVTLLVQQAAMSQYKALPMSQRIANALVSYVDYVVQLFYPVGLTVLYPWSERSLPVWKIGGALLVLGGISGAVWLWRRRCPYLLVGWLWYLGMLVPVIGLVQVGPQALADRYTYLPHVGLCVALAWMGAEACRAWPARRWVLGDGCGAFPGGDDGLRLASDHVLAGQRNSLDPRPGLLFAELDGAPPSRQSPGGERLL